MSTDISPIRRTEILIIIINFFLPIFTKILVRLSATKTTTRSYLSGNSSSYKPLSEFKDYQGVIITGVCLFGFAPLVLIFVWWKNKYHLHQSYYPQTCEIKGKSAISECLKRMVILNNGNPETDPGG